MGQRLFTCSSVVTTAQLEQELNEDQFLQIIPSSNPLQELKKHLKRLPEEILVKILILVENNFQVFYVNVFRMYPCFKKYRGTIERALKNEHLKQILCTIRRLTPRQCILLGEYSFCGKLPWETQSWRQMNTHLTYMTIRDLLLRAKVKFVKYGSHGALSALISINSIEHYVTGTLEKIRVPSKKKIYFITGIEMYGNAVRLNFIDGNALWKENVFLFR